MTNADKFKAVFGIYSEEFWAKPDGDMLNWINSEYQEPQTNADIIRAMSDEELAEFIEAASCPPICYKRPIYECSKEECVPCWLAWLQAEVKE